MSQTPLSAETFPGLFPTLNSTSQQPLPAPLPVYIDLNIDLKYTQELPKSLEQLGRVLSLS